MPNNAWHREGAQQKMLNLINPLHLSRDNLEPTAALPLGSYQASETLSHSKPLIATLGST